MPSWTEIDKDDVLMGFRMTVTSNLEEELLADIEGIQEWQHMYLSEVAREVAEVASDLAPMLTGRLQNSIRWGPADTDAMSEYDRSNEYRTEYKIGTDVWYGRFQEFGWTMRNGARHPGNPFLRPALYQVSAKMDRESVSRELAKFLESRQPPPAPAAPVSDVMATGVRGAGLFKHGAARGMAGRRTSRRPK